MFTVNNFLSLPIPFFNPFLGDGNHPIDRTKERWINQIEIALPTMMFMTDYRIKGVMCKRKLNFFELEPSNMFTNLTCSAGDKYL